MQPTPKIQSILLPTDFSDAAELAFAHALKLAVVLGAKLDILHVEPKNDTADWRWGPKVAATLSRWGVMPEGATPADLERRGIDARQTTATGTSANAAILNELANSHADLVVMATHGRSGLEAFLQPSVSTPVVTKGVVPVLLLPPGVAGFVDPVTGDSRLRRILLPIDHRPHPAPGFDAAALIGRALGAPDLALSTIHYGRRHPEPDLMTVEPEWNIAHWTLDGPAVDGVLETARTWDADLIVLVTEGRKNWVDALRGSTVERIVEQARAAVLIVPAEWGNTLPPPGDV